MILRAPAKINLGLDVLRKREDGYHEVKMVMQTVAMFDTVEVTERKEGGITLETNRSFLPTNENNLAYKAAALLMNEFNVTAGLHIRLQKFIPVAAGLAGGSSDAAAVLIGVNRLFGLGLTQKELMERGRKIGADVPYCILGGTALAEGIGEILTPLPAIPDCSILLAKPSFSVSTREIYQALRSNELTDHPDIDGMTAAIRAGDLDGIVRRCDNVLERVTAPRFPVIGELEREMLSFGAFASIMSGSGPTVFGIFPDQESALACKAALIGRPGMGRVFATVPMEGRRF